MVRFLAYFLALVAFFFLGIGYFEYVHHLGFPDGHVTDYQRAAKILYFVLAGPMVALGCYFLFLGYTAQGPGSKLKLSLALSIFLLAIILSFAANHCLFVHLDHGQGG